MGWYEDRFTPSATNTRTECSVCSRPMWLPKSKSSNYKTCGGLCAAKRQETLYPKIPSVPRPDKRQWDCVFCAKPNLGGRAAKSFCTRDCRSKHESAAKEALRAERSRACKCCNKTFVVKKSQIDAGQGVYCSQACARADGLYAHLTTPANLLKAKQRRAQMIADGLIVYPKGEAHFAWEPNRNELQERKRKAARAACQNYRKTNPHKVKEFTLRRNRKKFGRLPAGTVNRIGDLQKWKCVVCRANIKTKYHVDHIFPIAKGGKHEATNIQLLCPTCNVRKSAKDPLQYMQERGFLL